MQDYVINLFFIFQASVDSEDARAISLDVANASISSAASVSSSCSSAGIADGDNSQNKQFNFSGM